MNVSHLNSFPVAFLLLHMGEEHTECCYFNPAFQTMLSPAASMHDVRGFLERTLPVLTEPFLRTMENGQTMERDIYDNVSRKYYRFTLFPVKDSYCGCFVWHDLVMDQNRDLFFYQLRILEHMITMRDIELESHIRNVSDYTGILLRCICSGSDISMTLTQNQITVIMQVAAFHDIGKLMLPDELLKKRGSLTPDERRMVQTHCVRGAEILESLSFKNLIGNGDHYRFCHDICLCHHERWDGRGYPRGLKGKEIPIWAHVVAVADVYDALTSNRRYKGAIPHDEAVRMILNGECGAFSPQLMKCFQKALPQLKAAKDQQSIPCGSVLPKEKRMTDAFLLNQRDCV